MVNNGKPLLHPNLITIEFGGTSFKANPPFQYSKPHLAASSKSNWRRIVAAFPLASLIQPRNPHDLGLNTP